MHELLYCSYADSKIGKEEILSILETSRKNNEKLGITGILLYWQKTREFIQVLEGEEKAIFSLFEIIKKDPRHSHVKLIYDGPIQERSFNKWSMAFQNFEEIDKSKLEGFSNFSTKGFTNELTGIEPSTATQLIKSFRDLLP